MAEVEVLRDSLDTLAARVEGGASEVRTLRSALDGKAEVEDVNAALLDVCGELEKRAGVGAVDTLARAQVLVCARVFVIT